MVLFSGTKSGVFTTWKAWLAEMIQPKLAAITLLGLFSVTACQHPNASLAEARTTGTTSSAPTATSSLTEAPSCPNGLKARLETGLIVKFEGSVASDPSICIQEWGGKRYEFCLGLWNDLRVERGARDQCSKLNAIMQAPAGTTVSLDLSTRLWKSAVVTRETGDSLVISHRQRPTMKLRVVRQGLVARPGTMAESLYWVDRATGVPLKKQSVTRMTDGHIQRVTTWRVASLETANVAETALPNVSRAVTD